MVYISRIPFTIQTFIVITALSCPLARATELLPGQTLDRSTLSAGSQGDLIQFGQGSFTYHQPPVGQAADIFFLQCTLFDRHYQ